MIRRTIFLAGIAGLLFVLPLYGQTAADTALTAPRMIIVRSVPEGAEAWLDGRAIGHTPVRDTAVSAGTHTLSLYYPTRLNWNAVSVSESLDVQASGSTERLIRLPDRALIISDPSEADVYRDSARIGRTPLEWTFEHPAPLQLALREVGYEPATVTLDSAGFQTAFVRLTDRSPRLAEALGEEGGLPSNRWLTEGSAAASVVSGILAAALKERANSAYDSYLVTLDPGQRDRSRRLDTAAGVAFAVMQVSIGLLMYSLISE